jgi:AcrR family transcriptional regulator
MSSNIERAGSNVAANPSLRQRQLQLREDAILDAAHELMAQHGYGDMSMDGVAAHVGISKATLYQHFPSKEELAISVILRAVRRIEHHIRALDPSIPAIQRLVLAIQQMIEQRFSSSRPSLNPSHPPLHPALHKDTRFLNQKASMEILLADLVEEAKSTGDVVPHLPTRLIVKLLLSSVHHADYAEMIANEEITIDELKTTVVSILFDGLHPGENLHCP